MTEQPDRRELWTKESIQNVENSLLQRIIAAETPEATEAAISYAEFLRERGLSAENYPVFLKMLTTKNRFVLDALVGPEDPFELFSKIPPNRAVVEECFELLDFWSRGGIHPTTLAVVLGILRRAYSDPRDGFRLYPVSVADVNNLAKHLNESEPQSHPQNRVLLDVLDDVGSLEGSGLGDAIDKVARQALKIRNYFLDNTRSLDGCLPPSLMETGRASQEAIRPRRIFVD